MLKKQLNFQRAATTSAQMQEIVSQMQTRPFFQCPKEFWNPIVDDTTAFHQCWRSNPPTRRTEWGQHCRRPQDSFRPVRRTSGRRHRPLEFRTDWTQSYNHLLVRRRPEQTRRPLRLLDVQRLVRCMGQLVVNHPQPYLQLQQTQPGPLQRHRPPHRTPRNRTKAS